MEFIDVALYLSKSIKAGKTKKRIRYKAFCRYVERKFGLDMKKHRDVEKLLDFITLCGNIKWRLAQTPIGSLDLEFEFA